MSADDNDPRYLQVARSLMAEYEQKWLTCRTRCSTLVADADQLRAALTAAQAERDQLSQEVVRHCKTIDAAQAENAELRQRALNAELNAIDASNNVTREMYRTKAAEARAKTPAEQSVLDACAAFTEQDLSESPPSTWPETKRLHERIETWRVAALAWLLARRAEPQPTGEEKP